MCFFFLGGGTGIVTSTEHVVVTQGFPELEPIDILIGRIGFQSG